MKPGGVDAHAAAGKPDAILMSCGLRTLDVIVPLESAIGVPVVSSTPHGLWHCARTSSGSSGSYNCPDSIFELGTH